MSTPVILDYLKTMTEREASDLYLTVGHAPSIRMNSDIYEVRTEPLSLDEINDILSTILTNRQRREYESNMELNASLDVGKYGRYRVNVLKQKQSPALVIRRITAKIPDFESLRLPKLMENLALMKRGLILLTGMTGSGKSTTLASMIDYRNRKEQGHIITIEDPIEYFHDHKKSIITQREVGVDTESYEVALKNALRQRPDVILVGEIRDRKVMEQALVAAETGHLCLATLHTNNTYQAIERIVNFFPEEYQTQVRQNLSLNLKAILSQRLIPSLQGGVTLALEVMLNQGLVKELILKGEIGKIPDVMYQNVSAGMCTFDQSLLYLYQTGQISEDTALSQADQAGDLKIKMRESKLSGDQKEGQGTAAAKSSSPLGQIDTSVLSLND